MLFNSIAFLLFFPAVLIVDLLLGARPAARKTFLLAASLYFYGSWDWRFLGLLLISTVLDWFVGRALHASEQPRRRKRLLWLSMAGNLGILGTFKYFDFFAGSLQVLLRKLGWEGDMPALGLILPVGISFYTFQTMSYTLDIYRRQLKPARSFLDFFLFVAFFPQLVAGPIVRASTFLPQLEQNPRATRAGLSLGLYNLAAGLFKKVVIADSLGVLLVDPLYRGDQAAGALAALAGVYGYAFQIYGDFAGYSQIAIGAAQMLGFRLPENFRSPYLARTCSEFWERWHISLSSFLRDYLYIGLGGNRGGRWLTYRNLMITMLLGGLWHGAGWNFLLWGAIHGCAMILSHWRRERRRAAGRALSAAPAAVLLQRLTVFHLWAFSMVFFRAPDLETALRVFSELARFGGALPGTRGLLILGLAAVLHAGSERWKPLVRGLYARLAPELQGALLLALLAVLSFFSQEARPFIYFQF